MGEHHTYMKIKPRLSARILLYSIQASGMKFCGAGPARSINILRYSSGELTKTIRIGPIFSLKTGPSSRCLLSTYSCSFCGPPALNRDNIVPKKGRPCGSGGSFIEVPKSRANVRNNAEFFTKPWLAMFHEGIASFNVKGRGADSKTAPRLANETLKSWRFIDLANLRNALRVVCISPATLGIQARETSVQLRCQREIRS